MCPFGLVNERKKGQSSVKTHSQEKKKKKKGKQNQLKCNLLLYEKIKRKNKAK